MINFIQNCLLAAGVAAGFSIAMGLYAPTLAILTVGLAGGLGGFNNE